MIMIMRRITTMRTYNPQYGNYRTRTLSDIVPTFDDFKTLRNDLSVLCPSSIISDTNLELVYDILIGTYGESHIASSNEPQFKINLIKNVGSYAPAFIKSLDVQKKLMAMDLDSGDIVDGNTIILNHAENPNSAPSTQTLSELTYIDSQNTQKYKRSKLEGYANLLTLLDDDLYGKFAQRFANMFVRIAMPQYPLYYENEGDVYL